MTTEEIQVRRAQVEQAIVELLDGFMRESGLAVTELRVDTYTVTDGSGRRNQAVAVRLKAELP